MYNQYSQFVLDIYRHYFGFVATRQRFKARKDSFFEFQIDPDSQADQQILRRLSISITKISDICFKECIQTNYKLYTTDEEWCVKNCVKKYFQGYEHIANYTTHQLYTQ